MDDLKNSGLVVFSHGKETGPWGTKIKHLASVAVAAGWQALSVDYAAATGLADAPPEQRLAALLAQPLPPHSRLVLVGSSMGGWVSAAACAALQPDGLFLMAPALNIPGYPAIETALWPAGLHVQVVHGWQDDVIPAAHSINFARLQRARLHLVNDDHRLGGTLPEVGVWFDAFLSRLHTSSLDSPTTLA